MSFRNIRFVHCDNGKCWHAERCDSTSAADRKRRGGQTDKEITMGYYPHTCPCCVADPSGATDSPNCYGKETE